MVCWTSIIAPTKLYLQGVLSFHHFALCVCALTRVGGQSPMYMCPAQYAVQLPCWSKSRCVGATSAVGRRSCKKELWVASGQYCFKMVAVACGPASKHGHGNESFWHRRTTQLPQASKADCNKAWILRLMISCSSICNACSSSCADGQRRTH